MNAVLSRLRVAAPAMSGKSSSERVDGIQSTLLLIQSSTLLLIQSPCDAMARQLTHDILRMVLALCPASPARFAAAVRARRGA